MPTTTPGAGAPEAFTVPLGRLVVVGQDTGCGCARPLPGNDLAGQWRALVQDADLLVCAGGEYEHPCGEVETAYLLVGEDGRAVWTMTTSTAVDEMVEDGRHADLVRLHDTLVNLDAWLDQAESDQDRDAAFDQVWRWGGTGLTWAQATIAEQHAVRTGGDWQEWRDAGFDTHDALNWMMWDEPEVAAQWRDAGFTDGQEAASWWDALYLHPTTAFALAAAGVAPDVAEDLQTEIGYRLGEPLYTFAAPEATAQEAAAAPGDVAMLVVATVDGLSDNQVLLLAAAGLSVAEIKQMVDDGPVDWATIATMAALRDCVPVPVWLNPL